MCSSLIRATFAALVLMLVAGCAAPTPAPTAAPTQVAERPTQTPYPTSTAYATYTPYPTATLPPTSTLVPPTPTATETATLTPTPTAAPVTPRPAALQPAAPVGSADLWRTPGSYTPVAANLCATFISSYEDHDWEETFCIIHVDVTPDVIRFYGQWKIKLVRGSFRGGIYHLNSRYVTYVVDNVGNKYVHGRLGGAADEDRLIQSPDYLMGYKDNQNANYPHEPDSWWEFELARPGVTSFTFVNDKYGFRIGPITLAR